MPRHSSRMQGLFNRNTIFNESARVVPLDCFLKTIVTTCHNNITPQGHTTMKDTFMVTRDVSKVLTRLRFRTFKTPLAHAHKSQNAFSFIPYHFSSTRIVRARHHSSKGSKACINLVMSCDVIARVPFKKRFHRSFALVKISAFTYTPLK